jgi:hypothetical protein
MRKALAACVRASAQRTTPAAQWRSEAVHLREDDEHDAIEQQAAKLSDQAAMNL